MKKLLILLLAALPAAVMAQTAAFETLYNRYADMKGATTAMVGSDMVKAMGGQTAAGLSQVGGMRIISIEKSLYIGSAEIKRLKDETMKIASGSDYKLVMDVKDDDEVVRIYAKRSAPEGVMKDTIILISEPDEVTVIYVEGELNADAIRQITKSVD